MQIHCEWYGDMLLIKRNGVQVGRVEGGRGSYIDDNIEWYRCLTFSEIEHIFDCWNNMVKKYINEIFINNFILCRFDYTMVH